MEININFGHLVGKGEDFSIGSSTTVRWSFKQFVANFEPHASELGQHISNTKIVCPFCNGLIWIKTTEHSAVCMSPDDIKNIQPQELKGEIIKAINEEVFYSRLGATLGLPIGVAIIIYLLGKGWDTFSKEDYIFTGGVVFLVSSLSSLIVYLIHVFSRNALPKSNILFLVSKDSKLLQVEGVRSKIFKYIQSVIIDNENDNSHFMLHHHEKKDLNNFDTITNNKGLHMIEEGYYPELNNLKTVWI